MHDPNEAGHPPIPRPAQAVAEVMPNSRAEQEARCRCAGACLRCAAEGAIARALRPLPGSVWSASSANRRSKGFALGNHASSRASVTPTVPDARRTPGQRSSAVMVNEVPPPSRATSPRVVVWARPKVEDSSSCAPWGRRLAVSTMPAQDVGASRVRERVRSCTPTLGRRPQVSLGLAHGRQHVIDPERFGKDGHL